MEQCHNCGARVAESAVTCPECGVSLADDQQGGNQHQGGHQHQGGQQGQPQGGHQHQGGYQGQPQGRQQTQGGYQGQPQGGQPRAQPAPGHKPPSAPAGIKALCIVLGIFGVFLILGGLFLGAIGGAASQAGQQAGVEGAGAAGGIAQIVGIVYALLGIAYFVVIYGLWNLRDWGWIVAVALLGLGILLALVNLLSGGAGAGALINILISGGLIAYLWTKRHMYNAHRFLPIDPPQQPQQAR